MRLQRTTGAGARLSFATALAAVLFAGAPERLHAQPTRTARTPGTAVLTVGSDVYSLVIECDDAAQPEAGFSTLPSRLMRERHGRTNGANVRLRAWDEREVVVSVDRFVAWLPTPSAQGDTLRLQLAMSRNSELRDKRPVLMTHERWQAGERFGAPQSVSLKAWCGSVADDAPSYRRRPPAAAVSAGSGAVRG